MSKKALLVLAVSAFLALMIAVPVLGQSATVTLGGNDALGKFLVGPNGMTLYVFGKDSLNSSVCSGKCAEFWPPLIVASAAEATAGEGIPGALGTITREDGTLQVTYNGWPLYYWANDKAVGDATGQDVGHIWWVIPPATVYVAGNADLGKFLVGPNGMTLYMFTNDTVGVTNCYDKCATNWPPLTVASADAIVSGVNVPGELGTTERTDGTLQVTYNGWPLYYFVKDAALGDAVGEKVGDVWYTIAPETVTVSSNDALGNFLVAPNGMTLYMFKNDTAGVSNCADDCAKNWPPFTVAANERLVAGEGAASEALTLIDRADGSKQVAYNGMPLYYFVKDAAVGDTVGQAVGDVWYVVAP